MISLFRGRRTVCRLFIGFLPQICGGGIMNSCKRFMVPPHFQGVAMRSAMKTCYAIFHTLRRHSRTAESAFVLLQLPSCAAPESTRSPRRICLLSMDPDLKEHTHTKMGI